MDDLKDLVSMISIGFGILALCFGIIMVPVYFLSSVSCNATGQKMNKPTTFSLWTDCMVEYQPGKWIQMDKYHGVDAKVTQ